MVLSTPCQVGPGTHPPTRATKRFRPWSARDSFRHGPSTEPPNRSKTGIRQKETEKERETHTIRSCFTHMVPLVHTYVRTHTRTSWRRTRSVCLSHHPSKRVSFLSCSCRGRSRPPSSRRHLSVQLLPNLKYLRQLPPTSGHAQLRPPHHPRRKQKQTLSAFHHSLRHVDNLLDHG